MRAERKLLEGWKRCIMPVQRTSLTARIDKKSGHKFGIRRKGQRCQNLVPPDCVVLYGAAVCQSHIPHYLAALKTSVEHDAKRRAQLDPGCDVE